MSTTQRPLPAPDEVAPLPPPSPAALPGHDLVLEQPPLPDDSRHERNAFAAAVGRLRTGGQSLALSERTLMVAAGVVAPLGLVFVLLGWYGAARTSNLFEQIPYLISGGLFGLGLVFLGAFFYFAHWLTELVKESRAGSAALLEAVAALQQTIVDAGPTPSTNGTVVDHIGHVDLVATARGAMAHRPDCPVVVGKDGLRPVSTDDSLAPCKMCEPYGDAPAR